MIILGIDGGGSKTHALAVNEHGEVLGTGSAGPSGYHSLGMDKAMSVVRDVAQQALGNQQPDYAVYCLACCDSPRDELRLNSSLSQIGITDRFTVYNDAFAALRAGTSQPYGVAIICGTGFNACAIGPNGNKTQLYSLGALTGDWGGGYSIGEAAVAAAFRADDGRGEPTVLTEIVLNTLGETNLPSLADRITDDQVTRQEVARLSPLTFKAADEGDKVAQSIIIRLADEMAVTARAMLRKLDMCSIDVDVVLGGGVVYGQGSLLMDTVTSQVLAVNPHAHVKRINVPPVVGAALLAYDALGVTAPEGIQQQLTDLRPHV